MIDNGVISSHTPKISENDRLTFALFLALVFHAMLAFGIVFSVPDPVTNPVTPAMQVVLAQYHSEDAPENADFIGQTNQQGGGEKDVLQMPTTTEVADIPDPSKQASAESMAVVSDQQQQPLPQIMTGGNREPVFADEQINAPEEAAQPLLDTATLLQRSMQITGSTATLDDQHILASKNLRSRTVAASIKASKDADYLDRWRRRIEEVGNQNYPAQARAENLYGELLMKVAVNANGTVREVVVIESSGSNVLDEAAVRIVRLAAPFAPFDDQLRAETDVLEIVRLWQFEAGNRVSTR